MRQCHSRSYRLSQALKGEQRHINAAQNKEILTALMDKMETQKAERTFTEGLTEPEHLYDIGRTQETEFDPKAHRERFYINTLEKKMARTKRYGNMRTTASVYGDFDLPKGGPEHGRMNVTKTFNDKGHLVSPASEQPARRNTRRNTRLCG